MLMKCSRCKRTYKLVKKNYEFSKVVTDESTDPKTKLKPVMLCPECENEFSVWMLANKSNETED